MFPVNVMLQSPIFKNDDFNLGGTDVGTTQYIDAFQRANFWSLIDRNNYHTLLHPSCSLRLRSTCRRTRDIT